MKKMMLAAVAAGVLVSGAAAGEIDLSAFSNALEKEVAKKKGTLKGDERNLPTLDASQVGEALCEKTGTKTFTQDTIFGPRQVTIEMDGLTEFQMNDYLTEQDGITGLANVIEAKAAKFSGLPVDWKAAESFIDERIAKRSIDGGVQGSKEWDARDMFKYFLRYISAEDFKAKNKQDHLNEVIRRNVALRAYFATISKWEKPKESSSEDAKAIRHFVENGKSMYPQYFYQNGFKLDDCKKNIEKIGTDDFHTAFVLVNNASYLKKSGFIPYTSWQRSDAVIALNAAGPDYKAMYDKTINELKNRKVIK